MTEHKPQPWSYSALNSFELCPKRHWHLNVKKDYKEPPSEALNWGSEVHKAIERRLKSGKELPVGMKHFEALVAPLAGLPGEPLVEQKLALDADLQPCGWYDERVWVRCVIDAAFINEPKAILIDWKTGKRKDDDDQLALMAAVMFAQLPGLESIDSAFAWLAEPASRAIKSIRFLRADLPTLWGRFLPRVAAFQHGFAKDEFPAIPGGLCRQWCPVRSCPYNGRG